jgi:hypothetical protein
MQEKYERNAAGERADADLTTALRLWRVVDAGELRANGHDQKGGHGVHWRTEVGLDLACRINWPEPGHAKFQQNHHEVHVSSISL